MLAMFNDIDHPNVTLSEWEASVGKGSTASYYGRRRPERLRLFPRLVRAPGTRSRDCRPCTIT
jgi:hypothetical protein